MATIVLSAVGAAVGSSIGGGVLGLSSAVIGRAVGATIGRVIDQRLLGAGSEAVETGKVDRFRIMGASEGDAVARAYGRVRIPGHVIWASNFLERVTTSGGSGKGGAPRAPKVKTSSYSVSLAVALCEGEITGVGRVWADGVELSHSALNMRVYAGSDLQMPDPLISAIEGAENAPAYRGIAYAVIEDLELGPYGNRVPQFSFEVHRPEANSDDPTELEVARGTRAVALIPGTGEYSLATTPVYLAGAGGAQRAINVNSLWGRTDFAASLAALKRELPVCNSVSLVVSWFGDDLRCGTCRVRPKVEQSGPEFGSMPWAVSGVDRLAALEVPKVDGRPVYGGTPTDQSVIEAIRALRADGKSVMFYPFLLMDQLAANGRTDPWTGAPDQPPLPWRGRITTSIAPGRPGTPDKTGTAAAEVAAFFGTTNPGDLTWTGSRVVAGAGADWGYRRFILHYARLCAAAGGVDAFCIGSEMRGLTQIRSGATVYPAVAALRSLLADVRAILGPTVRLSYASDWSEYFGHHPQDGTGDVFFHLDPLWADPNADFIAIDNYMPLSDWREGETHADAAFGEIYNPQYLRGNVAGGEGYDWYYATPEAAAAQDRTPITDGAHGEPWVFRYKDIRSWWSNRHHDRPGGTRLSNPTAWVPESKPVWFTEYGCPAVDKGTNEPNKFLDPKSSESFLPRSSNGRRDDLIQRQYLAAVRAHWSDPANNPVSSIYGGPMVDLGRAFVWAYDARPFPTFPTNRDLWSDGANHGRGHWLNGRTTVRSLAGIVREVCAEAGVTEVDVSRLYGIVNGYSVADTVTARSILQPLMQAYSFDAVEREGVLQFRTRSARSARTLDANDVVATERVSTDLVHQRAPDVETPSRVRATYVESEGTYAVRSVEAVNPDLASEGVGLSSPGIVLGETEAQAMVDRWLSEARVAVDSLRFALPPSMAMLGAGDVVTVRGARYRIDRWEASGGAAVEAVRTDASVFEPVDRPERRTFLPSFAAETPAEPVFLDLPLVAAEQVPHAPVIAVSRSPWTGPVAVFRSSNGETYDINAMVETPAVVGRLIDRLPAARPDLWDEGPPVRVQLKSGRGGLSSAARLDVLNGANLAAVGSGSGQSWEVLQFARAELVGPDVFALSGRLRGLAGTDTGGPTTWSTGSTFVLLTPDLVQLDHPLDLRGLARRYRVGPADLGPSDPLFVEREVTFLGIGLRPLSPVHLRAVRGPDGLAVSWIRRTRTGGDSWVGPDVPLGESSERYLLHVRRLTDVLRTVEVAGTSAWTYTTAQMLTDGVQPGCTIDVAQISEVFGPGPATRITLNV